MNDDIIHWIKNKYSFYGFLIACTIDIHNYIYIKDISLKLRLRQNIIRKLVYRMMDDKLIRCIREEVDKYISWYYYINEEFVVPTRYKYIYDNDIPECYRDMSTPHLKEIGI